MANYSRDKDTWRCNYVKTRPDGTTFVTAKRGFARKSEAIAWFKEYERKCEAGIDVDKEKTTLTKWLDIWYDTYCCKLASNTRASYKNNCDHIKKALGGYKLCDLKQPAVQAFYNAFTLPRKEGKTLSIAMLAHVHTTFNQAMKKAFELGYINRNPCTGTRRGRIEQAKRLYCTASQLKELLRLSKDSEFNLPIMLCAMLGLRRGEALGTKEDAIVDNTVEIRAQLTGDNLSGGVVYKEKPKTSSSIRTLVIPTMVLNEIKTARKAAKVDRLLCGDVYKNDGFICTQHGGGHISPNVFSRAVKKLMAAAGIDARIHLHDLRHSYATLLRQDGVPIEAISELLGHSDVKTTYKFYIGRDENVISNAANIISDIISRN